MKALVDPQKCTVCGVCQDVCPVGAITVTETAAEISDDCTLCGMCVDTCEFGAISLPEVGTGPSDDLASYRGVWVFAEWRQGQVHRVAHELLGAGRKLADKRGEELAAVLLGHQLDGHVNELIAHGADVVYVVDRPELAHFTDEAYAAVLHRLIGQKRPEILLAGATSMGRSFIPRVAALSRTGLTADCTELDISDRRAAPANSARLRRQRHGHHRLPHRRPQMATVRPKVMKPQRDDSRQGRIEKVELPAACFQTRVQVLEVIPEKESTAKLADAEVIVSGGRGLRNADNFELLAELARLINGAVGASRGAVDEGWMEPSRPGGPNRPNRGSHLVYGRWPCRRHPARGGHAGFETHRGGQQGPPCPDLRCGHLWCRCRPV